MLRKRTGTRKGTGTGTNYWSSEYQNRDGCPKLSYYIIY